MVRMENVLILRRLLHEHPELSGQEKVTQDIIKSFLRQFTTCEIVSEDGWFYAVHKEGAGLPVIAVRADMDAIPGADGAPFHGCGHDGHAAAVAGLAAMCEQETFGKNIIFLFQPAEETGEGALRCRQMLESRRVSCIYGCHSIPGYPVGEILWRRDVFACASRGMIIRLQGVQCHAAYPENGKNPAFAAAELVRAIPALQEDCANRGMVMATVVGVKVGARSFGVSAGDGEVDLTVRAYYEEDLERLCGKITAYAQAVDPAIAVTVEYVDVFPDTVNDAEMMDACAALFREKKLPNRMLDEPMRWSEDFGWYLKDIKGVFFGLGAGEDAPALHTPAFCYNDYLLRKTIETMQLLIRHVPL